MFLAILQQKKILFLSYAFLISTVQKKILAIVHKNKNQFQHIFSLFYVRWCKSHFHLMGKIIDLAENFYLKKK